MSTPTEQNLTNQPTPTRPDETVTASDGSRPPHLNLRNRSHAQMSRSSWSPRLTVRPRRGARALTAAPLERRRQPQGNDPQAKKKRSGILSAPVSQVVEQPQRVEDTQMSRPPSPTLSPTPSFLDTSLMSDMFSRGLLGVESIPGQILGIGDRFPPQDYQFWEEGVVLNTPGANGVGDQEDVDEPEDAFPTFSLLYNDEELSEGALTEDDYVIVPHKAS